MQRKNRSVDARSKRGTLKTGWYGLGRPFMMIIPNTADSAAPRIGNSYVMGIHAGQLLSGFPPIFRGRLITFANQHMKNPAHPPRNPPVKTTIGKLVHSNPTASAKPSTGIGV